MAAIRKVYVFSVIPRLSSLVKEKLPDVDVVEVKFSQGGGQDGKKVCEEDIEMLKDAEILLVDNNLLAQVTDRLPKLKWAQGTWAGVEGLIDGLKGKPKPTFPVTRMVGDSFGQLMAEYVVGWIITHERGWLEGRQSQLKCEWVPKGPKAFYRSLQDLTVGVLGMGNIGKEVARSLKAFRAGVNAYSRSAPSKDNVCENVDRYWHTGELAEFLRNSDYIVNIMPSTPTTRGMLDGDVLKDAKKNAVLINIGRGDVISEANIIRSLDVGWISAAILDVFTTEPLPAESPLWRHPKVILTPHTAGESRPEDVAQTFVFNYRRYIEGLPLMHIIDWSVGY